MTIFRTALFCFGGAFVGVGYSTARRGKPNGRPYAAAGVLLLAGGILLYVF